MISNQFGRVPRFQSLRSFSVAACLAIATLTNVGCGGGGDAKTANIQPGNMPDGETWTGVYFHPVYGKLHLVEQGTNVIGKWKRTDESAWGQLSGTKMGNVLRFQWTEHKYGMTGPSGITKGRGVFVYKAGKEGIAELDGQYGLADSEVGGDWHCIKQQRQAPDLNSITGDSPDTVQPGGFE